ncbi:cupredoxin domain-containing protein, partial [Lysobacter rhizosphaerae]
MSRRGSHRLMEVRWSTVFFGVLLSASASAADHVVTALSNLTFSPKNLTIAAGDTVTFRNGGGLHNVTSAPGAATAFRCANGCDGAGGSGNPSSASWSATVTFPVAGMVGFYCEIHGSPGVGMAGTITVTGAPPPPPPPPP